MADHTSFDPLADALERLSPSLVTVFGRERQPASGLVMAEGVVLTADHVLEREEGLTIRAEGGEPMEATFVGRDLSSDLAVLRVEGLRAPVAEYAERARVGQLVLAAGRPWGENLQASLGTVSVIGGPMRLVGRRRARVLPQHLITDAIPYPGFSGGALVGANGLLGILTTGLMRGATTAIPATLAWSIGSELAAQGRVRRGYLGITSQPVALPEAQRALAGQGSGLLLIGVEEGSPAETGGLLLGDVLIALDGEAVADSSDLQLLLAGERVGREVEVTTLRGGERKIWRVTVAERQRGRAVGRVVRLAIVALVPAVRAGLRALLDGEGVRVVGEAATVAALAPLLSEADVLLLADELTPAEVAAHAHDDLALVLLGEPQEEMSVVRGLALRGWALLPLDASAGALRAAVLAAAEGLAVLPPVLAGAALSQNAAAEALVEPLTARELEVLQQVSYGLANKEIARALQISEHTVKFHLSAIFSKLDASSRTEAVSRAARLGLIML